MASTIDQSDAATQTDISAFDDTEELTSVASVSKPQTYSTSLYIDTLSPSVTVPFREDTEVMIFLNGFKPHRPSDSRFIPVATSSPEETVKLFASTMKVESSVAADGHPTLGPLTARSEEVTQGQSEGSRSLAEVMERSPGQNEVFDYSGSQLQESVCQPPLDSVSSLDGLYIP